MNKAEIAEYLVNLHTLMAAQEGAGLGQKSTILTDEYNKFWKLLKQEIVNETRNGNDDSKRPEVRADKS